MEGIATTINSPAALAEGVAADEHTLKTFVLRNITVEGLEPSLKEHLRQYRIRPRISFGGYGTMFQDTMNRGGAIADADLVILSLALEELDAAYGSPGWRADEVRGLLEELFSTLKASTGATIALNTFLLPLHEAHLHLPEDGSDALSQVAELNRFIAEWARGNGPQFRLLDWNRYVGLLGAQAALDPRGRYLWKAPFKPAFLDLYAHDIARIARLLKGHVKKCVVFDCDNTLWGGVIGEDGLDGIKLDANQYPGKAYFDFHTSILNLADRGVVLALCSKNNDHDVFDVLDRHPACRLKRSHFAAMRLNWRDKAENLASLACELNLGLDSFVFVDDNPAECELVRTLLPEVTVLAVPEKRYELPSLLAREGLFDALARTAEDRARTRLYEAESHRKSARTATASLDEYLAGLEMIATIHQARPEEIPRIAQLTQKTNQFNLTTQRYTEQAIAEFSNDPDAAIFTMSVRDRFGELGLVGVMIVVHQGGAARIDSLLLSCRALGRGLEQAFVEHTLAALRPRWDVADWRAEYIATRKNRQVADFWQKMGFSPQDKSEGRRSYIRDARASGPGIPRYIVIKEC